MNTNLQQAEAQWKQALKARFGTCDLSRLYSHEMYGESPDDPLRTLYDHYARLRQEAPVGPFCPFPREAWDDTCVHPPGCAKIVEQLRSKHLANLDRRVAKLLKVGG